MYLDKLSEDQSVLYQRQLHVKREMSDRKYHHLPIKAELKRENKSHQVIGKKEIRFCAF